VKALFEKIIKFIPEYFSNLISLLTGPKSFLAAKVAHQENEMRDALIFLGISAVLCVILTSPITNVGESIVTFTILLCTVSVIMLALLFVPLFASWKIIGGTAPLSKLALIFVYENSVIVLLVPILFILFWPNFSFLFLVLGIITFLWRIVIWGAYRKISAVSKGRSIAAFIINIILSAGVNYLSTIVGWKLGWLI